MKYLSNLDHLIRPTTLLLFIQNLKILKKLWWALQRLATPWPNFFIAASYCTPSTGLFTKTSTILEQELVLGDVHVRAVDYYFTLFYFTLFYSILFYLVLFCFILFYFILFHFILFLVVFLFYNLKYSLVLFLLYNDLRHTDKQEMELPTCVCTSLHFCQLLTDHWRGRTSFLSSEIIIIIFYFILF